MNIDSMPAGPAMNALLAVGLMGWRGPLSVEEAEIAVKHDIMPDYSQDDGAAVEIIKHFASMGKAVQVYWKDGEPAWYACNYDDECLYLSGWSNEDDFISCYADTFALAVCRFAILWLNNLKEIKP